jgi:hypothetical protein
MTDNGHYHYRDYKEMGMRAREANVPKSQIMGGGIRLTRTQKAFWKIGWEEADRKLGGIS